MTRSILIIATIVIGATYGWAQQAPSIDQRVSELEKRVSELERRSQVAPAPAGTAANPFEAEQRKDRYELLKADQKIQENLPEVIAYFREKKDTDAASVEARTHQAILKLCDELTVIVPKIIAAKADDSVSSLIARQRQIFKSFDAILATEHTAEMENRYHISERTAELIRIDREYNQKALDILSQ
jgi:hypothetical protein